MHELSIAQALADAATAHAPEGSIVRVLRVRAGPLRAIDSEALQWAWKSVTAATSLAPAILEVKQMPWRMRCPECHAMWDSVELCSICKCGCDDAYPVDGDELLLDYLEVDDEPAVAERGAL